MGNTQHCAPPSIWALQGYNLDPPFGAQKDWHLRIWVVLIILKGTSRSLDDQI